MKSKMIGVFAALLIALMAVGFTYASWSPTLQINGNVATGNVDAQFSLLTTQPDVGCSVTGRGSKTLTVTITNAYPQYTATVPFTIVNLGSLPAKIGTIIETHDNTYLDVNVTPDPEGASLPKSGLVTIRVRDAAAELATYTFTITFTVVADV